MKYKNFITIEGIDGSGKSTYVPVLQKMFEDMGYNVVLTREPGGTPYAEQLRNRILNEKMSLEEEVKLAFLARQDHLEKLIVPALEDEKTIVISDRYTDSTYAYQGAASGCSEEKINEYVQSHQKDIWPALTLVFSVPVEISQQRLNKTGKIPDKFESKDPEFFLKCIEGYNNQIKKDPERCKFVDSSKTIEQTTEQVQELVREFVEKNFPQRKKSRHP